MSLHKTQSTHLVSRNKNGLSCPNMEDEPDISTSRIKSKNTVGFNFFFFTIKKNKKKRHFVPGTKVT